MSSIGQMFGLGGGTSGARSYNSAAYAPQTGQALGNLNTLGNQAMTEAQNPAAMPDVAGAEFANALSKSQSGVASEVGGMKGLSPAAAAQLISQGGATAAGTGAGQAAVAGMQQGVQQQQLHQQQEQLAAGIQSNIVNPTMGYQTSTQNTNAGLTTGSNAQGSQQLGSIIGAVAPIAAMALMSSGGPVPGRAEAKGDAPKNDTVPAMLSPGEVVLPRSVYQAEDAPEKAAAFVAALKKTGGKPDKATFNEVLASHKRLGEALKRWKGGEA